MGDLEAPSDDELMQQLMEQQAEEEAREEYRQRMNQAYAELAYEEEARAIEAKKAKRQK